MRDPKFRQWRPLLTAKASDESKQKWNAEDSVGVRTTSDEVVNVEYHRDVRPILARSCIACHTSAGGKEPAGNLNLDADAEEIQAENLGKFPGTYYRLALDERAKFGHKPFGYDSYGYPNASRYVRKFQARRSLLTWKIFGRRMDGFSNDDHPSQAKPGDRQTLTQRGEKVDSERNRARWDIDFVGSPMPPPDAVKKGKVQPLSDEDRRTLVRWIDLGCPIDLDFKADAAADNVAARGYGWLLDDNRPVLAVTLPQAGKNARLDRIVIGAHDYYTGVEDGSLARGNLTVSVADRQGNVTRVVRTFVIE